MKKYKVKIYISSDDFLEGTYYLTQKEIDFVNKIFDGLERMGDYAPTVELYNLDKDFK